MPEQIQNVINRIKEWWAKFTRRQHIIIISLTVFTLLVFIIITYAVSRPQYVRLMSCKTTTEAVSVTQILDENNIAYKLSADALNVDVETGKISTARLALASGGYVPDGYSLEDAMNRSMSTTSTDADRMYKKYLETELKEIIEAQEAVKTAKVVFDIPEQNGTLIAQQQESSAFIQLELNGTFTSANAANLAKGVATMLGNETTANITIIDDSGNLLFAGGDDYSTSGIASSLQELQNQAECMIANQVKRVLLGTNQYNNAEVTSHLDMDYSNYEKTLKHYYANEDRTEGMLSHEEQYDNTTTGGVGGVPGTDSNGEGTTYVTSDYETSSSVTKEISKDYLPNEDSVYTVTPAGGINYTSSSISIAAITYTEIYEKDVETQGLLDGITWEEYKLANAADVKMEVDQDYYSLVSTATGIPVSNITIVAYQSPIFYDKESLNISMTTVLSAALFLLILGLLAFVVLRSMGSRKPVEQEEEISVEDLLQSAPEEEIENIDVETKSETRKMIEKFVDENPEAAAILLRNWLNDEWG
jgi:flagellar M-ring protein FliF